MRQVQEAMEQHFDSVEPRWAWTTNKPRSIIDHGICIPDIEHGFAGYKGFEVPSERRVLSGESSSSVYVGPAVSKAASKKCPGALSAAIPYNFFKQHCYFGGWILDLMCGTGSAAIAAQGCGLNSVSVDISKRMVRFVFFFVFLSLCLYL